MKDRNEDIRQRMKNYIEQNDVNISKFCRRVRISHTTFYKWSGGKMELTQKRLDDIENHISQFGF